MMRQRRDIVLVGFLILLHILLQWPHLQLDFWNDELYSLEHFVFQSYQTVVTDYHSTNNHVLFSLAMRVWSNLIGIHGLSDAVGEPWPLRLVPLLFSCVTIIFCYRIGNKIAGPTAALTAAIVLITSIPFYNYAAQVRGYSLSMCLFSVLCYLVLSTVERPCFWRYCSVLLLNAALLYTLPSNLYYVAALLLFLVGCLVLDRQSGRAAVYVWIIGALLAGCFLALLQYLPLISQMKRLPILASGGAGSGWEATGNRLPVVAYHFLSARYLLIMPMVVCLLLKRHLSWGWAIIAFFLAPFIMTDVRASSTPYRVFLTALPIVCCCFGIATAGALNAIKNDFRRNLALAATAAYCLLIFFFQVRKTEAAALSDIEKGTRAGDLYFQYNLHYFHPRADAEEYMRTYARPGIPLLEQCRMDEEVLKYLSMAGWDRASAKNVALDSVLFSFDTVDVLTERPSVLLDSVHTLHRDYHQLQLLPGPRSVQIIRLSKALR